jgi:hypothetical protein
MKETIDKMLEMGFLKCFTSGFISNSEEVPHTEVIYAFRRFDDVVFEMSLADIERIGVNAFKWSLLVQAYGKEGSVFFEGFPTPPSLSSLYW